MGKYERGSARRWRDQDESDGRFIRPASRPKTPEELEAEANKPRASSRLTTAKLPAQQRKPIAASNPLRIWEPSKPSAAALPPLTAEERAALRDSTRELIDRKIKANPHSRGLRTLIAGVGALGACGGLYVFNTQQAKPAFTLSEETLAGTWELQAVGTDPVGEKTDSMLLSQRVTFAKGRLHGETHLRADTTAASTAMPFPDQTATDVKTSADGHEVAVSWDGKYKVLENNRLELSVGKAQYRLAATIDSKARQLTMDHDAVLTFKGATHYGAALSVSARTSASATKNQ